MNEHSKCIYDIYLRSAIAILAKAEALAAKFNAAIDDDECDYFWSEEFGLEESRPNDSYGSVKIGNKDWKLKIVEGEKDWYLSLLIGLSYTNGNSYISAKGLRWSKAIDLWTCHWKE